MNADDRRWISSILFSEDIENIKEEIRKIDEPLILHTIAGNYNWNDGYEIPEEIVNNDYCDLGTALLIFFDADGYTLLGAEEVLNPPTVWVKFLMRLYNRIANKNFRYTSIAYLPPIPKALENKIRMNNPNIPEVFFVRSPGIVLEMPRLHHRR